jgi:ABC-2 type transport system permease protein
VRSLAPRLDGVLAVVRRDADIYFSYRFRPLAQVVIGLFSVALFYYISRLVGSEQFPTPDDYFAYVVVGLVVLQGLTATMTLLPSALRTDLVAGSFERVAISPLGPAAGVASMTIFPMIVAVFAGTVTLAIAAVIFGLPLASTAPLAIPAALLAILAFLPFALLVAALVLVSKQAGNIGSLVVVGLSLAGGVYYPPELMPGWIRWVTDVQPFTPALETLRHLLTGAPTTDPPATELARLAAFAVLATPVAYRLLVLAVRACRRRGTLLEY